MSKSLASVWQGSPQICCLLFSNFPSTDPLYPACWSCKSPAVFALLGVEFSFTEAPIAIVLNKICLYSVKLVSNSFWEMFELFQNIEKHENLHSSFNQVNVTQIATNKVKIYHCIFRFKYLESDSCSRTTRSFVHQKLHEHIHHGLGRNGPW